ncbi:hypothetical protein bcere0022_15960 [Bacillus cereus Rock3-44]|nr:hypothetical protein bcere0022_15960 [Bacillus cereus Rock3-44]
MIAMGWDPYKRFMKEIFKSRKSWVGEREAPSLIKVSL